MRYSPTSSYSLSLHKHAEDDLEALYESDEDAAATIDVFLQEARCSQDMLDTFSIYQGYRGYLAELDYDVTRWKELWKQHNLWRIRLLNTNDGAAKHRIIYAFHPTERRYYILGIVPRSFEYELGHPLTQRIIDTYHDLAIP